MSLTEDEIAFFIMNGYLMIRPASVRAEVHSEIISLAERAPRMGANNSIPMAPPLLEVMESREVDDALTSLLGPGYIRHGHQSPHDNRPGSKAQRIHKDSYYGYERYRHPEPWWVMAMYYPQKTTVNMAPTSVVPGSQYFANEGDEYRRVFADDGDTALDRWHTKEVHAVCEAGTVLLIHYDIFHRGTANTGRQTRWMFKFQFTRGQWAGNPAVAALSPTREGWLSRFESVGNIWGCAHPEAFVAQRWRLWAALAEWMGGASPERDARVFLLEMKKTVLEATCDAERFDAVCQLANVTAEERGGRAIVALLRTPRVEVVRAARFAATILLSRMLREGRADGPFLTSLLDTVQLQGDAPLAASAACVALGYAAGWQCAPPSLTSRVAAVLAEVSSTPSQPPPSTSPLSGNGNPCYGLFVNYAAAGAEALGSLTTSTPAVQRGVLLAAREAKGIVGDRGQMHKGEWCMGMALAAVRVLLIADERGDLVKNLTALVGALAVARPCPPLRKAVPGYDCGMRYALAYAVWGVMHSANEDAVCDVYEALQSPCELPPASTHEQRVKALAERRCHLTTQDHPF